MKIEYLSFCVTADNNEEISKCITKKVQEIIPSGQKLKSIPYVDIQNLEYLKQITILAIFE